MAGPGLAPAATGGGGVQSKRPGQRRLLPRALRRGGRGPGGRLAGRAPRARARRGGRRGAHRRPDQGASRAAVQSTGAGCDLLWGDIGLGLGLGLLACSMRPLRSTSLARAPGRLGLMGSVHKRCGRRGARHGTGVQPYKGQVHRGASKRLEPGEGLRVQRASADWACACAEPAAAGGMCD